MSDNVEICRFLVEEIGVPLDDTDAQLGQSPLFFATATNNQPVTQYLLERMALADLSDKNAQTPLFYAARHGHHECLRTLLEHHADPNRRDVNCQAPHFYAVKYSHVDCSRTLLEWAGGVTSAVGAGSVLPESGLAAPAPLGAAPPAGGGGSAAEAVAAAARDMWGRTALFYAVDDGCTVLLLERKCTPDIKDMHGQSAIFEAAKNGHNEKLSKLLEWRADPDARDRNRQTPLFYACDAKNFEACKILVEAGANPLLRDCLQQSPLRLAEAKGNDKLLALLQQSGHKAENVAQAAAGSPGGRRKKGSPKGRGRGRGRPPGRSSQTGAEGDEGGSCGDDGGQGRELEEGEADGGMAGDDGMGEAEDSGRGDAGSQDDASPQSPARKRLRTGSSLDEGEASRSQADGTTDQGASSPGTPTAPVKVEGVFEVTAGDLPRAVLTGTPDKVRSFLEAGQSAKVLSRQGLNLVFQVAMRQPDGSEDALEICRMLVEEHGLSPTYVDLDARTALFYAARNGHTALAAYLVGAKCDVQHRDSEGRTPIFSAAALSDAGVTRMLLDHRADPEGPRDPVGSTPLRVAAGMGGASVLELLLERGACPARAEDAESCIFAAAQPCVAALVAAGCNPCERGRGGRQPTHAAALRGDEATMAALLEAKGSIDAVDVHGRTALHYAVEGQHLEMCVKLIETHGIDGSAVDVAGLTAAAFARREQWEKGAHAIHKAIERRERTVPDEDPMQHMEAMRRRASPPRSMIGPPANAEEPGKRSPALVEPPSPGLGMQRKPLFKAAAEGRLEMLTELLQARGDPSARDRTLQTPLFAACLHGAEGSQQCVEALLEARASPDATDAHGQTPLFRVALSGSTACAKTLLEAGANASLPDSQGNTPLYYAIEHSHAELAAFLIDTPGGCDFKTEASRLERMIEMAADRHMLDVQARLRSLEEQERGNAEARAALQASLFRVARCGPIGQLEELIAANADVLSSDAEGRSALHLAALRSDAQVAKFLLEKKSSVECKDARGQTPLFASASSSRDGVTSLLLEWRASVQAVDSQGRRPLHYAVGLACTKQLLEAKASPEARDVSGQTPLFVAARRGDLEVLRTLAAGGAEVGSEDSFGQTALFSAAQYAPMEVVRYLVEEARADPCHQDRDGCTAAMALQDSARGGTLAPDRNWVVEFLQPSLSARGREETPKRGGRANAVGRYCLVFRDTTDQTGSRIVPFASPEYEAALRRLGSLCPWLRMELWPAGAPLTRGPMSAGL